MEADGLVPAVPPIDVPHVVDWLMEVGPVENTGMGPVPVSWMTIDAWRRSAGRPVPPWQARLLRRLSSEWLAEARRAEAPDCPAPWQDEATVAANRNAVDRQFERLFGS